MLGPNRTVGLGIRGGDGEEEGEEEASRCVVVVLVPVVRCLPCTQDSCPLCSAFASIWNRFSVKGRGGAECVPLWLCQSLFAVLAACSVVGRAVCGRAPPRRTAQCQRSALFSLLLRLHTARDEFGNAVDGESGESCRVAVTVAVATRNASALLSRSWSSSASSLPPSTFFGTLRGVLFQQSRFPCAGLETLHVRGERFGQPRCLLHVGVVPSHLLLRAASSMDSRWRALRSCGGSRANAVPEELMIMRSRRHGSLRCPRRTLLLQQRWPAPSYARPPHTVTYSTGKILVA